MASELCRMRMTSLVRFRTRILPTCRKDGRKVDESGLVRSLFLHATQLSTGKTWPRTKASRNRGLFCSLISGNCDVWCVTLAILCSLLLLTMMPPSALLQTGALAGATWTVLCRCMNRCEARLKRRCARCSCPPLAGFECGREKMEQTSDVQEEEVCCFQRQAVSFNQQIVFATPDSVLNCSVAGLPKNN